MSFASLTESKFDEAGLLDSFDVLDALLGQPDAKGRDHFVSQNNGNSGTYGLRAGKWKLHRYDNKRAFNVVVEKELANTKVPQYQLFDLEADPAEKKNVRAEHPEVADRLIKQLAEIIKNGRSR